MDKRKREKRHNRTRERDLCFGEKAEEGKCKQRESRMKRDTVALQI
jgi:hypothetical protein